MTIWRFKPASNPLKLLRLVILCIPVLIGCSTQTPDPPSAIPVPTLNPDQVAQSQQASEMLSVLQQPGTIIAQSTATQPVGTAGVLKYQLEQVVLDTPTTLQLVLPNSTTGVFEDRQLILDTFWRRTILGQNFHEGAWWWETCLDGKPV